MEKSITYRASSYVYWRIVMKDLSLKWQFCCAPPFLLLETSQYPPLSDCVTKPQIKILLKFTAD